MDVFSFIVLILTSYYFWSTLIPVTVFGMCINVKKERVFTTIDVITYSMLVGILAASALGAATFFSRVNHREKLDFKPAPF